MCFLEAGGSNMYGDGPAYLYSEFRPCGTKDGGTPRALAVCSLLDSVHEGFHFQYENQP